jgi:epoxyqueuosine reductase
VIDFLTQTIKNEALRLGFALVGVTTPDPPPHVPAYENWLAMGRHGHMAYLADAQARYRRANPRLILPECRTILVLAARYATPNYVELDGESSLRGHVAAYAWGDDYHLILPNRLKALVAFIEIQVGHQIQNRWYTDTGPLLERDLAQRAGLGWIGKNTCLINPKKGSYFLLAEILLGIELEPDTPFSPDRCGACTRCIDVCPTQCILPNRTLDARRCISYLTIELKEDIPLDLREQIGNWVFGCDLCQMVCPWNRFSSPQGDSAFEPRYGVPYPDLIRETALTPDSFNRKFKKSPVARAKRRGYLRNVAVALGNNVRNGQAILVLEKMLNDTEPIVRVHAAWALNKIKTRKK